MCGICGLFDPSGSLAGPPAAAAIAGMMAAIARRGPDDSGSYADGAGVLRLGFRRLAILDLSAAGHQPMVSRSGRSVLVFNGEIYNYPELRRELAGAGFPLRSRADSEVLLELLERDGLALLPRLRGMFAFAFYEIEARRLTLARDPFGIKPLHLQRLPDGRLAFASQLDALQHVPWEKPDELDPASLALYLRLSHLPPPYGFYRGTAQLPPGSYLRCDARGQVEEGRYYHFAQPDPPSLRLSREELVGRLDQALARAVERERLADVPLGVFLSGGIDSPLVASYAAAQTGGQVPAFVLANSDWGQDEGPAAGAYAAALGLAPRVAEWDEAATLATWDDLAAAQSEPFADFSLLPTLLLSRFARREVKVVLSGDGGDELFFGYERPLSLLRDGAAFAWPRPLRRFLYAAGKLGLARRRGDTILFPSPGDYYFAVNSRFPQDELRRVAPGLEGFTAGPPGFDLYRCEETGDWRSLLRFARRAELAGQLQRGLKKVDMASMYFGLEARVPLLDLEVAELAAGVDPLTLVSAPDGGFERKSVLRGLLGRKVPAELLPQKKLGFSVPLAELLRTHLKERAASALFDAPLRPAGLFERRQVAALWKAHQDGRADAKWALWALITLQLYLNRPPVMATEAA